jgi:predicted TIM-barrel fold metal-dependent hydrolase
MILDAHAHIGTWKIPQFCGRSNTLEDAVKIYKKTGVSAAIVTTTDEANNERLIADVKKKRSLFPFIVSLWISPDDHDIERILATNRDIVGMLKIHPSILQKPVISPKFRHFFELAREYRIPVSIHCGRWQEVSSFRFAFKIAERHSDVNIILGHMGGDSPDLIKGSIEILMGNDFPNVFLGTESIREYWMVQEAVDILGPSKLIFGSDYNLNYPASFVEIIKNLDLNDENRNKILSGNMIKLLPKGAKAILSEWGFPTDPGRNTDKFFKLEKK